MFTVLLQGLCSRGYETAESENTLQLTTFMFTPRIAQFFWLVLGIRGKRRLLLTDASYMPNACLEMLTTFPVVRCCVHFFLYLGRHLLYLHSLVLNSCTDFVCSFPSLSNGCMVTVHVRRALHWLHCIPALFVAYGSSKLSRPFARFAPTAYFTARRCSVYPDPDPILFLIEKANS